MSLDRSISPQWGEVTAVFGGRFDPPHLGHREAVRGLFKNPGVKQVLILPTATPSQKIAQASSNNRIEMAKLNFQSNPADSQYPSEIQLSLIETERTQRAPHVPSYSFDSIQELKQHYAQLAFVIGIDQLINFSSWHRFPEILGLCHWIVLQRQSQKQNETLPEAHKVLSQWAASGLARKTGSHTWALPRSQSLILVPTEAPELSSTHIRETIARTGAPPQQSLLPEIEQYLKSQRLYGIERSS